MSHYPGNNQPLNGPLTLHQFTSMISNHVNSAPQLANRWVLAEIARIGMSGPHCYCELIEKDERGNTIARIKGTIWANSWRHISASFHAATGRHISAGMKVMFLMSASHAAAYGLSANITGVDPTYTLGDAERRRREILEMLRQEGIIDFNRSLTLAPDVRKIAVISAATAAGYGDFINQLDNSGFVFYPLLYPAAMQGLKTASSVMEALDKIEMAVDFWDAVVIIRGGGATDDLNSFDNAELARRVATFPIPIIVGIGHERDRTVLDEIANVRCKTPTAVAAFLIERLQACENHAVELTRKIVDFVRQAFVGEHRRISYVAALLPVLAPQRLGNEKHRIANIQNAIRQSADISARKASEKLTVLASRMESAAINAISRPTEYLDKIPELLKRASENRLTLEIQKLDSRKSLIDVLNPAATLKRGYSITRIDGKAIRSIQEIKPGNLITTTLPDGEITSTVKE